jgi:hypothetical protein
VVAVAKLKASQMHTSLSALLESYLRKFTSSDKLNDSQLKASQFLKQIPAKKPAYPFDDQTDDQWLAENLK